ncbi:MAG TPA: hypothetical protein VFY16_10895 [Gemmatimonadaceae bacterium]|jgi:hypothetical protein|nr:hypothetical protein [Gemmatimonadaceae bacterium]
MSVVFLASLLVGLLLAVYTMLTGVERPLAAAAGSAGPPFRTALGVPALGGFLTAFGIAGYLLYRAGALGAAGTLLAATLLGLAALGGAIALVTKWAVPAALADAVDERYVLQGTPARVIGAIGTDGAGEIVYVADGREIVAAARSFDGSPLDVGSDVVIDRVEDGVAYVEQWAVVEQRL